MAGWNDDFKIRQAAAMLLYALDNTTGAEREQAVTKALATVAEVAASHGAIEAGAHQAAYRHDLHRY